MPRTFKIASHIRRSTYRRPFASTTALALVFSVAVAPHALAQSVILQDDTNPSDPTTINGSVDLQIGVNGTGTLTIQDGGMLTNGTGFIGYGTGSQGMAGVSGNDGSGNVSTWTNTGDLIVGQDGTGALLVSDGGRVSNNTGYIGVGTGSTNTNPSTVVVSGRDSNGNASTWSNAGDLYVGDVGTATLDILGGGSVYNVFGTVGNQAGSNGTVTVSGTDGNGHASSWTSAGPILIGNEGSGTLLVEGGGMVNSGQGLLGGITGSGSSGIGTVTVSGIDANGNASAWTAENNIYVGFTGTGVLAIADGGVVSTSTAGGGAASVYVGLASSGMGTVTVSSSTADVSALTATDFIAVGVDGDGTLNVERGGLVRAGTNVRVADTSTASGTLNLLGDTNGRGILETGSVIKGDGTATINLDGGILRATRNEANFLNGFATLAAGAEGAWFDTNTHDITVATVFTGSSSFNKLGLGTLTLTGDSSAFAGTITISAGTLQLGNGGTTGGIVGDVANDGVLAFHRSDEIEFDSVIKGTGAVRQTGTGTTILTGANTYTGGTTISAGTLQLGDGGTAGSIAGNVANTGTLVFDRSDAVTFAGVVSGSGAVAQAGTGTTILTGANTYTGGTTISAGTLQLGNGGTSGSIVGNLTNNGSLIFDRSDTVAFDGLISGSGTVVKNGAGVLNLTADNSHVGATTVNTGTLLVNGNQSAATGQTVVNSGATLGGSGTLGGDLTITDGATLAPGNSAGTLTINGSLALASGSVVDYQFGQANVPGGSLNDLVNVGGNLVLDGALNVSVSPGGTFGSGIYRVFNYNGTLTDNGLALGSMPSGSDVFVQTSIDHQVNLVNSAGLELKFWDGLAGPKNDRTIDGGDGTWHLSGADDNWTEATGAINAPYENGSFAVFGGASGKVTVDNAGGVVTTAGMQFATNGYVISGDALTLVGPQSTIRVGDGTAAGAGYTATINAELTGNSQILKTDLGTLVLTGTNTYTGGTIIQGGTVRIASDANLGDATGGLSFNGGRLNTTADITSGRSVDLAGSGTFLTDAGTTVTLTGTMSGAGSLTKDGDGTLVIAGNATQSGGTTISAGTLRLGDGRTTGSIAGNVANSGTLVFDRSDAVTFAGVVSGSGAVAQAGTGTTILTGASTYAGGTTISAGTLQLGNGGTSGSIVGDVFNNGALVFDRSDQVFFGGEISGTGGLAQIGTGTTTLTGTSSYTGSTDVFAGTLNVNGSIADSVVFVHNNGTLSGAGTVGATTVARGGVIAPGNGIGTLTVNGDYEQQAGSTYRAEVEPTSSNADRIAINGTATLASGATVDVVKAVNAPYTIGTRYTILTTTGGLRGRFDLTGEADITAFIRLIDEYDANNAYLVTKQSRSISSIGSTPNQIATGSGVDGLPTSHPLSTAVLNLPDVQTANYALDQLSGEIHASVKTATIEQSHFVRDIATDRIREAFCGIATKAANHARKANEEETSRRSSADCSAVPDRPMAWGQAFGSWGHTDTDGNAAKLDRSIGGFIAGADAAVFDTWRFGVLAGYGSGNSRVDDRNSSATTDEFYFGLYGGTQQGRLGFRIGATYTWQNIDTKRSANFSGFSDGLSAAYSAGLTQIFSDLGYRIDTHRVAFEPFSNLAYVSLDTGGFTEHGGAAALRSPGNTTATLLTTFGLRASTIFDLGGVDVLARGSIGWRHAFADTTPISTHAFNGGALFDIAGVPIARNAVVINAGLDFNPSPNTTLGVSYGGQLSKTAVDQSVRGTFSLKF